MYDDTSRMGKVDWILLCLKSTSLDAAPRLVEPLLKSTTRIIAIMNGMIDEDLVNLIEGLEEEREEEEEEEEEKREGRGGGMEVGVWRQGFGGGGLEVRRWRWGCGGRGM